VRQVFEKMIKKQIAMIALAAWLMLIFVFMYITQNIDIEVFFVFGFIGLLTTIKLIEPKFIQPGYMRYFWYIVIVGIIAVGVIAALKTLKNF
jgi:ABC-type xylose transport system permease subunit